MALPHATGAVQQTAAPSLCHPLGGTSPEPPANTVAQGVTEISLWPPAAAVW